MPKIIELPNNRVDLVFEINEGDKTGVKEISFVGNDAFSRRPAEGRDQDLGEQLAQLPADHRHLRSRTASKPTAICCAASISSTAMPTCASSRRSANTIRRKKGFIITFTIDEGAQYRFGTVDVISNVPRSIRHRCAASSSSAPGDVYNADVVEKTVEAMTIEAAKRGYAFATVRPRGDRDFQNHTINLAFVVDEGPRVYIERINIRGNTRTRDYVIRREFDIGEGDAYNRALIDRAERRLKNLDFFKTVKITNEPGSAPDRVVVNVDVEEQSTGEFSVAGGYSTADGFMAEVSVAERNLHGPRPVRQGVGELRPIHARASSFRSSSPICSAIAWPAASTCLRRQNLANELRLLRHADRSAPICASASR